MIVKDIYLDDWGWYVKLFFAKSTYYIDQILGDLESFGCSGYELVRAENMLTDNKLDKGLIYSNILGRCSIIVIGLTSSQAELKNICQCEKRYLINHMASTLRINKNSETFKDLVKNIDSSLFT